MKQRILVIISFLIISITFFGQSIHGKEFIQGPENKTDGGHSVCKADGGDFFVVGYTFVGSYRRIYVIKLNPFGDTIWTRVIGNNTAGGPVGHAAVSSGDGGCVLTGSWDTSFTVKLNTDGDIVWLKKYGGRYVQGFDIKKTPDGGYVACGRDDNVYSDGYVFKVDSLGNLLWEKTYYALYSRIFSSIEIALNGEFVIVGGISNFQQDSIRAAIFGKNSNGDSLWHRTYKVDGFETGANKIIKINTGYLINGGIIERPFNGKKGIYFMKTSFSGDLNYLRTYLSGVNEMNYSMNVMSANRYIISSSQDSMNGLISAGKARIVDSMGNIIIQKTYPARNYIILYSILPLNNGDILFAGEADFNVDIYNDVYAMRTDSMLNSPDIIIGITQIGTEIPSAYKLFQNYPNPFNSSTIIKFDIAENCNLKIFLHDVLAREIKKIIDTYMKAGEYEFSFNANNLASGVYYYSLVANEQRLTKKMIIIK